MPFPSKGRLISDAKGSRENKGGTITKGHTPNGVCIAMTAMWFRSIFTNLNVSMEGDQGKKFRYNGHNVNAESIFGFYRVKGDSGDYWEARKKLFSAQGLSIDESTEKYDTCRNIFDHIRGLSGPKAISIKVPGHAIAAYVAGPKFYFFDPNDGVVEYDNGGDFFIDAYIHAHFSYCDWQNEKKEVFCWQIKQA